MSALMNECQHGADGSYSVSGDPPHDYICPYCKIEHLIEVIESLHFHHKMFVPECRHCQDALVDL